jgi:phosphotriesterase-related protein
MHDDRAPRFNRRQVLGLLAMGTGLPLGPPAEAAAFGAAAQAPSGGQSLNVPKGAIVRTILKDVPPDGLGDGAALMHEHVTAGGNVDVLVDEVRASGREGVSCLVDAAIGKRRPGALDNLKTIASKSGVHIVAAGGYYKAPYPPEVAQKSEEAIADELSRDALAERWGAFGEIGTSLEMHADERKMLRAVGLAHQRTGIPVFTHIEHVGCRPCALEQLDVLLSQGVQPQDLCIGHMSDLLDDPTAETHKTIAKRGVFVGFDTVGHQMLQGPKATDAMKVRMIVAMVEAGYEDYVLLASDFAHEQCLKSTWGAGYSTVVTVFVPKLRYAGVKEPTIRKILVDNPRRFLAFVPKASA